VSTKPGQAHKKQGRSRKGTGTIYFDDKRKLYVGRLDLGRDAEGKRIRPIFYGKTEADVQAKMDAAKSDALRGLPVKPEKVTVAEHFDDWLRAKAASVRSSTPSKYTWLYRTHIEPVFGGLYLHQVDYRRINAFWEHLEEQGLARNTIASIAGVLRAAFNDAVRKRLILESPVKLPANRPPKYEEARCLSPQEVAAFLEAAKGERLEDFFIIALHSGMRPGELLGLSWDSVDLEAGKLVVRQALHEEDGRLFIGDVKTKAARRTISLSSEAIAAFRRQRTRQLKERLQAGEKWHNPHNLVFTTPTGGFLRRANISKRAVKKKGRKTTYSGPLGRILDRAGLEGVTLHTFRHTHASMLIAAGVDIKTVQRRLGHENVTITLQTYGHLLPGQDERAAEVIDRVLASIGHK